MKNKLLHRTLWFLVLMLKKLMKSKFKWNSFKSELMNDEFCISPVNWAVYGAWSEIVFCLD